MKIPIDVIAIWLSIMSDEELLRFRKRLEMNLTDWKREKRESLIDLFSAEIKRRKTSPQK
jgi:polyphosphate kinase 2 (PPK2 family)